MTIPASDHNQEYLTLCAWPDDMSRGDVARMLADVTRHDLATLRIAIGPRAPSTIGSLDSQEAHGAAQHVQQRGGSALAISLDDLATLGPTINVRDLTLADGRFMLKLQHDQSIALAFDEVLFLVKGRIRTTEKIRQTPRVNMGSLTAMNPIARRALIEHAAPKKREAFKTSEKLDIHTNDGRIYQIDGDRFSFNVLGDGKQYSDIINMNKMLELIQHFAPQAILDDFFSIWIPPPGIKRLRLPDMKANRDNPKFAFYSRWVALMYRHLMGVQ